MKSIKLISVFFVAAFLIAGCHELDLIGPDKAPTAQLQSLTQTAAATLYQIGNTYYVSPTGDDSGNGSAENPWRTLRSSVSKVQAGLGHTIKLAAGTYVESGLIEVPLGINIEGAGKDITILKAASSFYYNPADPGYATDKFLISLNGYNPASGNQVLKNFTINGDAKKLHGGIYIKYRNNVLIEDVKVEGTNFTGIWLWDVKDVVARKVNLVNCSWGSSGWCSGALNLGNLERVEIDQLDVNESTGYGVKAIGPGGYNNIFELKIHDSRVSVHPTGLWNNGSAPNIAIELWAVTLKNSEIYNTYVDNTISLVNSNQIPATGIQTIRVHHNILDMETRSNGNGYGVELTINDAEVDHNYFIKGTYGIANWDNAVTNWKIHHNVFYGIQGPYPGEIVRSQWSGLHNVKLYNNTIEQIGDKTSNVIGVYGGTSDAVDIKNNLIINSNTSYNWYPNQLVHTENGAAINNLAVNNNLLSNLPLGTLVGSILGNILSVDPKITKSGIRPEPYYAAQSSSPLIDGGVNVGYTFLGSAPDIGACEFGVATNASPQAGITSPANNASFTAGSSITIQATSSDPDGTIAKVEFFNGATKLGESTASPFSFTWTNVPAGSYSLIAKATDNLGAIGTSAAVAIVVSSSVNSAPSVGITSPANGSNFTDGGPITISANATDADGTISKVEFFDGGVKLGEDASAPYSYTWSSASSGSHSITASATDNAGTTSVSGPLTITIGSASGTQLELDASQATLSGQMKMGSNTQVGSFFYMPPGSGKNYYIPPPSSASYDFQVSQAGIYVVWARVKSPTSNNQALHIYDGNGRWTTWNAGIHGQWTWVKVTDANTGGATRFSFVSGANHIQFGWLDDNVRVDKILITNNLSYQP